MTSRKCSRPILPLPGFSKMTSPPNPLSRSQNQITRTLRRYIGGRGDIHPFSIWQRGDDRGNCSRTCSVCLLSYAFNAYLSRASIRIMAEGQPEDVFMNEELDPEFLQYINFQGPSVRYK